MRTVWTKISEGWEWLRRHAVWLLLLIVGAWVGARLYRSKSSSVSTISDARAVTKRVKEARALEREAATLDAHDEVAANRLIELNTRIATAKRQVAEQHTGRSWDTLSDTEIRNALKEAGL